MKKTNYESITMKYLFVIFINLSPFSLATMKEKRKFEVESLFRILKIIFEFLGSENFLDSDH